ncbi:MAG: hypothetical protein LBQ51_04445 [Desulfovibrio sp.]|nr:hypothetical protein [Desulfovibrio sp.]
MDGKGKDITDAGLMQAASVADMPGAALREVIGKTEQALSRFSELKALCK